MFRKLNAWLNDLIVNIILDYLKMSVHNLFTVTTNMQGGPCERSFLKFLNKTIEKHQTKSSFLVKFHVLKMILSTCISQGFSKTFK